MYANNLLRSLQDSYKSESKFTNGIDKEQEIQEKQKLSIYNFKKAPLVVAAFFLLPSP